MKMWFREQDRENFPNETWNDSNRWIYLAFPISGRPIAEATEDARLMTSIALRNMHLTGQGEILNPLSFNKFFSDTDYPHIMANCVEFIIRKKPIMLFHPNWEASAGCRMEKAIADELSLPIFILMS